MQIVMALVLLLQKDISGGHEATQGVSQAFVSTVIAKHGTSGASQVPG